MIVKPSEIAAAEERYKKHLEAMKPGREINESPYRYNFWAGGWYWNSSLKQEDEALLAWVYVCRGAFPGGKGNRP